MGEDDFVVLDNFRNWKVDALKAHLRRHGLSVSGNKELRKAPAQCICTQHPLMRWPKLSVSICGLTVFNVCKALGLF